MLRFNKEAVILTYLPTYPAYPTYLPTYLPIYLPTHPTYLHNFLIHAVLRFNKEAVAAALASGKVHTHLDDSCVVSCRGGWGGRGGHPIRSSGLFFFPSFLLSFILTTTITLSDTLPSFLLSLNQPPLNMTPHTSRWATTAWRRPSSSCTSCRTRYDNMHIHTRIHCCGRRVMHEGRRTYTDPAVVVLL